VLQLNDINGKPAGRELVLNKTNVRGLAKAFGDEMEAWVGRAIRIQSIWVSFRGQQVPGIRVAPGVVAMRSTGGGGGRSAGRTDGAAAPARKDDLDDEIPL
jgi:hypothetical protein